MKRILKYTLIILAVMLVSPVLLGVYLYCTADMGLPDISVKESSFAVRDSCGYRLCQGNFLREDSSGLWELYVSGGAEERGAKQGALTAELMRYQEDVFVDQIRRIIPSDSYLRFLRTFIVIFNRNLGEHIPVEYRREIASMSLFCTHEYDAIGTPYERQLNYHAAHDIGHAMQQYMLVGCSSFGAWGGASADSSLVIGRNFDFYVGDDFAKNKLITFCEPDSGYRYASVGWAGMIGVLSGMNEKGLTVTLNAAKGSMPLSAAMPISILAREIVQYASTIEEAYRIASKHKTFVSESLLIGSALDARAAIIEKTPDRIALYEASGDIVKCTNHYQSDLFATDPHNMENIENSDSEYRFRRLGELIARNTPISPCVTAKILRDNKGLGDKNIGLGNEMTLNQSIAHHGVIFAPDKLKMWVSAHPWQSGEMVCYDLKRIFSERSTPSPLSEGGEIIAADSAFLKNDYPRILSYRKGIMQIKEAIDRRECLDEGFLTTFTQINPEHYYTYRVLGDYYRNREQTEEVAKMYSIALSKEIPYNTERKEIEHLISKYK